MERPVPATLTEQCGFCFVTNTRSFVMSENELIIVDSTDFCGIGDLDIQYIRLKSITSMKLQDNVTYSSVKRLIYFIVLLMFVSSLPILLGVVDVSPNPLLMLLCALVLLQICFYKSPKKKLSVITAEGKTLSIHYKEKERKAAKDMASIWRRRNCLL